VLSLPKILPRLTVEGLRRSPVLVFGLGVLLVSAVSNCAYRPFEIAFDFVVSFAKILIHFVFLTAQVDSLVRLRLFLGCLAGIILIPVALSVAH
jgi:hypothetical protein